MNTTALTGPVADLEFPAIRLDARRLMASPSLAGPPTVELLKPLK